MKQERYLTYNSVTNLPMRLFLEILNNESFDLLGFKKDEENKKAWENILKEYKELNPDNSIDKTFNLYKDYYYNLSKFQCISTSLHYLSIKRDDELIGNLKGFGYVITSGNYYEDIKKCFGFLEGLKLKIKKIKEKLSSKETGNVFNFERSIIKLNRVFGFKIAEANTVTVSEYYNIKKEAEEILKSQKNEQSHGRGYHK